MSFNFNEIMREVPRESVFTDDGYYVWCASGVQADDGFYILYSRWKKEYGFDAWVSHSEVACAYAKSPLGPFTSLGTVLKGSGGDNWDRDVIHNPTVIKYDDKYYMYYMGNRGNGDFWSHRNNQRIGVAVAEHPRGPWQRCLDTPVIDTGCGGFDSLMVSNPTVAAAPDGRLIMVYKAVGQGEMPKGGPVVCGAAVSDHPMGPFKKSDTPIMVNPDNNWSVEDPFIWYMNDRFYALVKDFQGYFTKSDRNTVALFESFDGFDWCVSENVLAFRREIHWEDGSVEKVHRMERPQILLIDGVPAVLYCAVARDEGETDCFNVHIPLKL